MSAARELALEPLSTLFRALGDETRLRIVSLLAHGELCVCHLEAALKLSQPNISRHLGVLKHAGIVESRRDGNWVHYRLAKPVDEVARRQLSALVRHFGSAETLRKDVEALVRSRGPGACR